MNSKVWDFAQRHSQQFRMWMNGLQLLKKSSLSSHIQKKMINNEAFDTKKAISVQPRSLGQQTCVVSVEGNIGCGKTAMLNYYRNTQNCEIIPEPVHKWRDLKGYNVLELMYQNPERWGITLQTYIQLTMLQNHSLPQEKPLRMMERSIFSAKYCFVENLFRSGKMPEIEYLILTEWFEWIIETQNIHLDLIVYLRTDPEVLHDRIMKRCRQEEKGIPLAYLKSLHQLHEDWLVHKKFPCPAEVLIIDANSTLEKMPEFYEQHRNRIIQPFSC